jgi:DNA-binding PadR family transcriptional regulator
MSLRHSILSLLSLGDCHGYQLRSEIESRTGEVWQINIGQIYSTLDRLARDGLVNPLPSTEDGRVKYAITGEGRVEAESWLSSPVERHTNARDELAMKLALAVTLPGTDIQWVLDIQRAATLSQLQLLTTAKQATDEESAEDLPWILVLDSQIFALEAELRWLDHVEGRLSRSAARGLDPHVQMRTSIAKRGRPTKQK